MGEVEGGEIEREGLTGKALALAERMGYGEQARGVVKMWDEHKGEMGLMMAGVGLFDLPDVPPGGVLDNLMQGAEKVASDVLKFGFPNKVGISTLVGATAGALVLGGVEVLATKKAPSLLLVAANMVVGAAIGNHLEPV